MAVEVTTPDDFMGEVIGDLNSRRGQIQAMEERSGRPCCQGSRTPVGDVRLRRRSAEQDPGRASYSMQFDSYAQVPGTTWPRRSLPRRAGNSPERQRLEV